MFLETTWKIFGYALFNPDHVCSTTRPLFTELLRTVDDINIFLLLSGGMTHLYGIDDRHLIGRSQIGPSPCLVNEMWLSKRKYFCGGVNNIWPRVLIISSTY